MVEGYFDRLPSEILLNIALMLPLNSIKQLRCSSKFWYNLLTDPKFVDLHLTHALEKPPGYLFSAPPKLRSEKKACYFVEQSGCHVSTSKIAEFSIDDDERDIWDNFQSGGGLICAYSSQRSCFRIFNPHIGEEVQVPYDNKFIRWSCLRFMFSYSPSSKEYKILKMGKLYSGSPVAEICTLGSNIIWREIQSVPSTLRYLYPYTQCQGNLFWMQKSDLYYFDLVSEKFHVTLENGHLFGYMQNSTNFFSHDMGRKGFKVMERSLDEDGSEEQSRIADSLVYIAPHVASFVSPVRIMNMGKMHMNK